MSKPRDRAPIWARPAPGARRPRLTRERIAEVALAIADSEGFEAISMRRVAEELGAGTMTLYHYMRTKDDLLALMEDALMAEALVPVDELPSDWREALSAIARRSRDAFARHPWALQAVQSAQLGPNGMRHIEQSLAAVSTAPLGPAEKVALCGVIDDFVFGFVLRSIEPPRVSARAINQVVSQQLATGRFPHLAAYIGEDRPAVALARAAAWMSDEARFEFGLQARLDAVTGSRGLVTRSPRGAPSAKHPETAAPRERLDRRETREPERRGRRKAPSRR